MTFPAGVFIALGILAYLILWRYIFLQFFELFKLTENSEEFLEQTELNFFDVLLSNCYKSSDTNREKPDKIIANNSPPKQSLTLDLKLSISTLSSKIKRKPKRDLIRSNNLLVHQFYRTIRHRISVLKRVEHSDKIPHAYECLKWCSQPGIGRCENSIVLGNNTGEIAELKTMDMANDTIEDMQTLGNPVLRDIDSVSTPDDTELKVRKFHEKERGKDLDVMIRRLVAAELIKCCEKELFITMSRAHSETNNRVNWKRNKYNKHTVNLHANPASSKKSICDPIDLEFFSTEKVNDYPVDRRAIIDSTQNFVTCTNVTDHSESLDFNDDNDNDKNDVKRIPITDNDVPIAREASVQQIKRSSHPENVTSIQEPAEMKTIGTTEAETTLEVNAILTKFQDVTTQTEHMYMLRAVRSCPCRKKGHRQLLGTFCGMSKTKTNVKIASMEISTIAFLYRKASDNLIYEKGKGSRSPSYVSKPERFRWRYVTPSKMKN